MGSRRRCCCSTGTSICLVVTCSSVNTPIIGAVLQLYSGGSPVGSPCTTDATGCCTFTQTGTYQVHVTIGGTLVASPTKTLNGTSIQIAVSASSANVVCCGTCAIPMTLTLTDVNGTIAFNYVSSLSSWIGCYTITETVAVITDSPCQCSGTTTANIVINYRASCIGGQFRVVRSWMGVQCDAVTYLYAATTGDCGGSFPSVNDPCYVDNFFGAPPNNPFVQSASLTQSWSSCQPFAWSGTLNGAGQDPVDPVGGTVAISS